MKILLKELEIERIDEGCCLNQIIKFCNNRNIIYYALDFKFKAVSSNNGSFKSSDLPRLIFMINDNHLYPIEDPKMRETIFKSNAICGGGMKNTKLNNNMKMRS